MRPEHYPIVGKHLLASIREVLGEAATDELVDASAAAYGQLADLLIAEEARLYADSAAKPGGWTGWRAFRVARREAESSEITCSTWSRPMVARCRATSRASTCRCAFTCPNWA